MASFDGSKPWYTAKAIGKNTLAKMVKEICVDASICGRKTNHSLRATGVSDRFRVPEKSSRNGQAMDGLHQYQRTTSEQEENVSKVWIVIYHSHHIIQLFNIFLVVM